MKNYFRFLALTAALFSFIARGDVAKTGDGRVIENPTSNGDLKMRVNIGGTRTDILSITGSTGAFSLGPSSGLTVSNELRGKTALRGTTSSITATNGTVQSADNLRVYHLPFWTAMNAGQTVLTTNITFPTDGMTNIYYAGSLYVGGITFGGGGGVCRGFASFGGVTDQGNLLTSMTTTCSRGTIGSPSISGNILSFTFTDTLSGNAYIYGWVELFTAPRS